MTIRRPNSRSIRVVRPTALVVAVLAALAGMSIPAVGVIHALEYANAPQVAAI